MFRRSHPLTALGAILALCAAGCAAFGSMLVCMALLCLAYGLVLVEFKRYTSEIQFGMLLVLGTALGSVLDLRHHQGPWFTTALLLAASATVVRQAFMPRFTYVNWLWVDTGLALAGIGCHLIGAWGIPFSWDVWTFPLLPLGFAAGLTFSYVQDAMQMRKRMRFGYRVQLDSPAPDFELADQTGALVRLSDYKGKHPVLLIFVRGDWCPGCHMMLRTYERRRARFLEKGIHVLGIGPDDISVNKDMVERIGVAYKMLSDVGQRISTQYGVVYNNPIIEQGVDYAEGIPLPASFLVDVDGVVRYVSRPDRVGEFLDPERIFGVLDRIPASTPLAWS